MARLNIMKIKRLTKTAKLPYKAHKSDVGFDLFSDQPAYIMPMKSAYVSLGIAIQLPKGYFADIRPRSGMTGKTPLKGALGTIDNGYRGELKAIITNLSSEPERIAKGSKIAQLVIHRQPDFEAIEVDELNDSDRGTNGFGSTGK